MLFKTGQLHIKAFVTQTTIAESFYCADRFAQAQFKTIETILSRRWLCDPFSSAAGEAVPGRSKKSISA
jgi:hypothetical protein